MHTQASEHHVDGAESQPQHSTGEVNPTDYWAEATESSRQMPRPSVSSTSATGQGSSNPAHESEAASAPSANEQDSSRPTDDQIIAQENEIRHVVVATSTAAWHCKMSIQAVMTNHLNWCRQEAERLPFVGDLEPILALQQGNTITAVYTRCISCHCQQYMHSANNGCNNAEYQSGSSVFLAKIKKLETMYKSIRRARGDGNCFFRSFIFAYMENLVLTGDLTERNRYHVLQLCCLS